MPQVIHLAYPETTIEVLGVKIIINLEEAEAKIDAPRFEVKEKHNV